MGESRALLTVTPLPGIPLIEAGADLPQVITAALADAKVKPEPGDILVVAQKIVSKAEGRQVALDTVEPSPEARNLARKTGKDPRLVELILRESTDVVRAVPGVLIVRHRLGIISANAGIDQSNIEHGESECALLLPRDPDRSAQALREGLREHLGVALGVIISDSVHRPWRQGSVGIAIGCAGVTVLDDRRGENDIYGRELKITVINRADSIATAAVLVMGETIERIPAALVRGGEIEDSQQSARDSVRPAEYDLFL